MKDDDVTVILNKTQEYFHFIKNTLDKESIVTTDKDSETLKSIESYLKILTDDSTNRSSIKSSVHKSILSKCFIFLQHLDRIAKDYKLIQNGSSYS